MVGGHSRSRDYHGSNYIQLVSRVPELMTRLKGGGAEGSPFKIPNSKISTDAPLPINSNVKCRGLRSHLREREKIRGTFAE